jgi:hypothetical protein
VRAIAIVAAMVLLSGGLGIHLGPHGHQGPSQADAEVLTACAHHVRTLHVEPRHSAHFGPCPACLLSHTNLGVVSPLSLTLGAVAPEVLATDAPLLASLLAPHAASSRGPPTLSV